MYWWENGLNTNIANEHAESSQAKGMSEKGYTG
jgi:hypothetical protein